MEGQRTGYENTTTQEDRKNWIKRHICFFKSSLLLSSLTRRRFYPQQTSGQQAVVTGVYPSPPRYVPSFLSRIGFRIPTAHRFSSNVVSLLKLSIISRTHSWWRHIFIMLIVYNMKSLRTIFFSLCWWWFNVISNWLMFVVVVVVFTWNRPFYPASSAHPVSVLIFFFSHPIYYPRTSSSISPSNS